MVIIIIFLVVQVYILVLSLYLEGPACLGPIDPSSFIVLKKQARTQYLSGSSKIPKMFKIIGKNYK